MTESHSDQVFEDKVRILAEWVKANERMPSQISKDTNERRLRGFLSYCRQAANGTGSGANTFTPDRQAMLDRYVPGWNDVVHKTSFEDRVHILAEWVKANGRMPSQSANDPAEYKLGVFLGSCRQSSHGKGRSAQTFTPERRTLLDRHVLGWDRTRAAPSFEDKVRTLSKWVNTNGRMPTRSSDDATERKFAVFLTYCRQAARGTGNRSKVFTPDRRAMLDHYVPGWADTRSSCEANIRALGEWVKANGCMPSTRSTNIDEYRLGWFLRWCRQTARGNGRNAGA
ncbi:MAG: hypothetical protein M1522_03880, partial [Actinobacteria bacterium]|nr:hypothetical protein [Actinomycetota bacterium]